MQKKVMLLRRDESSLTETELATLRRRLGSDLAFVRYDPVNHLEHLANCEKERPEAVLLPVEKPIPSSAMERGYAHYAMISGSEGMKLGRLLPMQPKFEF